MSIWRRWLALGVLSAGLCGCGGDDSKKGEAAPGAAPGGGPPQAVPAAPPGPRVGGPPPVAPQPPSESPNAGSFAELLQFLPENLKIVAGANFASLTDKSNAIGQRLLVQFQPATFALGRAGIKVDQIERLWTGSNPESGDLVICARTKANYDSAATTKALDATGGTEKIGKATVQKLPPHGIYNNAIAYIDPRTLLIGRHATITAALSNPKPGAARFGFDAMDQADAYYWIAGDESMAREWVGGGGGSALGPMFGDTLRIRGMGIAFGGTPRVGTPTAAPGPVVGNVLENPEEPAGLPQRSAAPGQPGAPPQPNVVLALGMSFASEALATSIETKLKQLTKAGGTPAPVAPPRGGPLGKRDLDFQGFRRRRDDDDNPAPPAPQRQRNPQPATGAPAPPPPPEVTLASLGLLIERTKENLRIGMSIPAAAVPFIARFINDAVTATGASALSDGIFDGTLTQLAAGLREWPVAHPEMQRGVRRIDDLRLLAGYSWMTELLPFVGHADLHAAFDFSKSWADFANLPRTMTVIPAFLNPADPRATWEGFPESFTGMALTHFVGMSGVEDGRNVVAAELPRSDPRAGIFGYDEIAKLSDVTDGAGQTIMMIGSGEVTAPWVQGGGATIRGARAPYFQKFTGFGSRGLPRPGAFVLFADGSARMIPADIDPEVFKALCTMHGAEQIDMSKVGPPASQ